MHAFDRQIDRRTSLDRVCIPARCAPRARHCVVLTPVVAVSVITATVSEWVWPRWVCRCTCCLFDVLIKSTVQHSINSICYSVTYSCYELCAEN